MYTILLSSQSEGEKMNIKARETELRDRLHEAVDSMSLFEIAVLIFLVQTVRLRLAATGVVGRLRSTNDVAPTICDIEGVRKAIEDFQEAFFRAERQAEWTISSGTCTAAEFPEDYVRRQQDEIRPVSVSFEHYGLLSGYCTPHRELMTGSGESAGAGGITDRAEYWVGGEVEPGPTVKYAEWL
jgi:hypothetical protein